MIRLIKDDINKVNTRTWVRINEDSRKEIYKKQFLDEHGGKFVVSGRYVKWESEPEYLHEKTKYVVLNPENKLEIIEVFSRFCKEKNLNKAAMYGTLKGVRNHHKGYKLLKTPD